MTTGHESDVMQQNCCQVLCLLRGLRIVDVVIKPCSDNHYAHDVIVTAGSTVMCIATKSLFVTTRPYAKSSVQLAQNSEGHLTKVSELFILNLTSKTMSSDNSIGSQLRSGIKGIHGVGEAIRGTAMSEVDKAFGTSGGPEAGKNEAIAQKGINSAKAADQNIGHHHGVGSDSTATTHAVHHPTTGVNTSATAPHSSAGAHSTAAGNIGMDQREPVAGTAVQEQAGTSQRF